MKSFTVPLSKTLRDFLPLKPYFIQNRWLLAIGLLCLLLVDFLQLLIPLVIKRAIDLLTTTTATSHLLFKLGMTIVALAFCMALFRYVWRHLIFGHSRKVEEALRNRLYEHIQRLSLSFYQRTKTGDLMARATNDINAIRMAAGMGLVALTDGMVLGIAAIGFMASISIKLTLISLIPAPLIIILTAILTRRMSSGFERVQRTFADLTEQVREAFAGIRVIKAYNREDWVCEKVEEEGQRYISENMNLAKTLAVFFPMMAVFTNAGLAIVIWLGGRLTILGTITTGDFVAFTAYLNLLTWPMMAMGWVTNLIQRGSASMRRINRILEEVPEIKDSALSRPLTSIKGNIEFKGLTFKYPGQTGDALKDIRFKMAAAETVALVGRVGAGKTSLLQVVPRLLEVPPGTVSIEGWDIHEIPIEVLREHIGFVPQEVFVFADTIRNNVLFGRNGVSRSDLETVLRAADIWEEIQNLDKGLDTMLGERGVTLSGGQRQRLTLARALISEPPLLILDDALSMVDTRTEERILNRVLRLRQGKTNLIVSHRISAISRADHIVVLDRGKVVEEGTHASLAVEGRIYGTLYKKQLLAQELEIRGT